MLNLFDVEFLGLTGIGSTRSHVAQYAAVEFRARHPTVESPLFSVCCREVAVAHPLGPDQTFLDPHFPPPQSTDGGPGHCHSGPCKSEAARSAVPLSSRTLELRPAHDPQAP